MSMNTRSAFGSFTSCRMIKRLFERGNWIPLDSARRGAFAAKRPESGDAHSALHKSRRDG